MRREINYDEVFDAQKHYRILLDSMARPGKINLLPLSGLLPPAGIHPASVLTGFALLNADVSFCVAGPDREEIAKYLLLNTSSYPAEHTAADFIFISGRSGGKEVMEARTGSLPYPEDSATLIVDVEEISGSPLAGSIGLVLKGPGVEGEKSVYIRELNPAILEAVKEKNLEFPLGIDMIITDRDNRILCIPRSNNFHHVLL